MRPSKHSTGGGPVTVVGNSIRLQVPEVRWRRARAGGVYGLEGKMDSTGWRRVGATRMTSAARRTVCDSGSAPSNLQPCEHGRLVAFGTGKRWVLVGGNDVQKDDDPGCAGRRFGLGQTSPGHSDLWW